MMAMMPVRGPVPQTGTVSVGSSQGDVTVMKLLHPIPKSPNTSVWLDFWLLRKRYNILNHLLSAAGLILQMRLAW